MAEVYLGIYQCPRHNYTAICVDPLDDKCGVRLTPSKCCGSWQPVKRWKVDADEVCEAIQGEADRPVPAHPKGDAAAKTKTEGEKP